MERRYCGESRDSTYVNIERTCGKGRLEHIGMPAIEAELSSRQGAPSAFEPEKEMIQVVGGLVSGSE